MTACSIPGCDRKHAGRGFCNPHYQSLMKYGDPTKAKRAGAIGVYVNARGYKVVERDRKTVFEHKIIAERALGKSLPPRAEIHHANENKLDNRNANLVICPSRAYHSLLHQRLRALEACGNPNWRQCIFCKQYDDPLKMRIPKNRDRPRHRKCDNLDRSRRMKT